MSSTLFIRETPIPTESRELSFGHPLKGLIARRFYDHAGSLGGGMQTIGGSELAWFEGILAAGNFDGEDLRSLDTIVAILRDGGTIDMWFEC